MLPLKHSSSEAPRAQATCNTDMSGRNSHTLFGNQIITITVMHVTRRHEQINAVSLTEQVTSQIPRTFVRGETIVSRRRVVLARTNSHNL
jgi:hypothetical protein